MPVTKVISDSSFVCTIGQQRTVDDGIVKVTAISPDGDVFIMQTDEKIECAKDAKIVVNKFQEISDNFGERRVIRPIEWRMFSRRSKKLFGQPEFPHTTIKQKLQSITAEIQGF